MKIARIITRSVVIAGLAFAPNWNVDTTKAKVEFSIKGPFGTVHGNFSGLKADIKFDEKAPGNSSISATVDTKTISTGIGMRNHDLKKEEWFDADKYSTIEYHAKKVEKNGSGYKAIGELTMKGVTKPIEIPFTFTRSGSTGVFKGQFKVNREDFKVGKPRSSVGDEVTISLDVPVKQ